MRVTMDARDLRVSGEVQVQLGTYLYLHAAPVLGLVVAYWEEHARATDVPVPRGRDTPGSSSKLVGAAYECRNGLEYSYMYPSTTSTASTYIIHVHWSMATSKGFRLKQTVNDGQPEGCVHSIRIYMYIPTVLRAGTTCVMKERKKE